jgi:hypothetical protein
MKNRDYTLILDMGGTMATADQPGGLTRWAAVEESTLALARKCEKLDPDGITLYVFSQGFQRYDQVTGDQVAQIFAEHTPKGPANLAMALQNALNQYFQGKDAQGKDAQGKKAGEMGDDGGEETGKTGETILIITDGVPADQWSIVEMIIEATKKMERDEELALSFIQVGNNPKTRKFFKALDDQLQGVGAKFDICDTVTLEEMEEMSLVEVLMNAIDD